MTVTETLRPQEEATLVQNHDLFGARFIVIKL